MAIKTTIQFRRDTLANWTSANPTLSAGELALVDLNNGEGAKKWVVRIGDGVHQFTDLPETAYALKSEVESLGDNVILSAKDYTNQVSTFLNNAITAEADARSKVDTFLSGEISAKVKIEGTPVDYINVSRVDAETYHSIVAGGTADPKTIYIVSSDNINAFGEKVVNVGDATELSDAVNLKVLTSTVNAVSSDLTGRIDAVSGVAKTLSTDLYKLSGEVGTLTSDLTAYEVGVSAAGRVGDVYTYGITQGGEVKGTIEVPYDVFVDDGEVRKIGDKTYLLLTLNNSASTVLSIEATDLIDVYTGGTTDTISVGVDSYEITAVVRDGSITAGKLASNSVETAKVVDGAITTDKLGADAVTNAKLADDAVETVNIKDSNVTTGKLADDAVTNAKVADDAIATAQLSASAVTTAKIANDAVTNDKVADNAIATAQLSANAVTTAKIADSNVTADKLAESSVTTAKIDNGAITPVKMSNDVFVFDCGGANG